MTRRSGRPVAVGNLALRVAEMAARAREAPRPSAPPVTPRPSASPVPPRPSASSVAQCGRVTLGVNLLQGASVQPEPVRWLWPGWLAKGKLHVIAGQPGTGKTSLALSLAATLTAGGRWPDGTPAAPGNVLIWSGEDDVRDTLMPRLLSCGADPKRCFFITDVQAEDGRRPFDPARDMPALLRAAREVGEVRLLLVDPIVSAVAADSHKNAEVRRGLAPLVTLAERLDCALLGISHFSKGSAGRDPLERVTGSLAFGALARIVFAAFKRSEEDGGGRCLARVKSNLGPDEGGFLYELVLDALAEHPGVTATRVDWGTAVAGSARALLARAEAACDPEAMSALDEACAFLQELLAAGPVAAAEVKMEAEAAGVSERTLKRARKKLALTVTKTGMEGGWVWAL
ncbi:AAA family ATPase [Methylococcus geothermalis]|uniref:AAA family ATPase n=1 Tax=Methylococcus geothermalis TaxID=2681310 RepID=UPI00146AAD08|nr:AAA family ATPase [Methylococcus geothermalis]